MQKRRSIYRISLLTAASAAAVQGTAMAANSVLTFVGTTNNSLLTGTNYSPNGTTGLTTDLEFGTGYPSSAALVATLPGSLTTGTIDDLNTSYTVTMANNTSTGNTLTLGSSSTPANSVSPVSSSDLVYVPLGATLNIASNTSTGVTAVALGSGNLDIAGTASIQGIISGTNGLTKTGNGLLQLYQADTYTGTSIVNANISAGTVQLGTGTALGSATGDVTLLGAATLYCYDNLIPSYASSFSSGRTFNLSSPSSTIQVGGTQAWSIAGPIVGTGTLNVAGPGSLTLSYSSNNTNGWTGGTNIGSGTLIISTLTALAHGTTTIQNGATFEYSAGGTAQYSSLTAFALGGGNDTIFNPTANVLTPSQLTMFGTIGGSGNLVKTGYSSLVLENTNTWTGATNISGGSTLSLDYTSSFNSSALILGNATGSATFNTLSVNGAFNSSISSILSTTLMGGGSNINIGNFNSSSQSITLGTITRVGADSTLNVSLPSVGSVLTTSTAASFSGGQQTIIGGFATVNGTSWAYNNGGTLTGLASYNTSFGANSDVDVISSATVAVSSVNSMRFNTAASTTVALSAPLAVATGGILETSNVGLASSAITGGSLTSGNGTDLIISQYNTAMPLTIASPLTGSIALTKTGTGTVILSNTNTYTNGTFINNGTLGITSDAALGPVPATAAANITFTAAGATLQFDGAFNLSSTRTLIFGPAPGTIDTNSFPTTFSGNISGTALIVINSTTARTGLFTLGSTAIMPTVLGLGSTAAGGNFNLGAGRTAYFNLSSTSLLGGANSITSGSAFNFSLGSISHSVGSQVNFLIPTTGGNIITTTANANIGQGQQSILGAYATVNGTTWAVSGSGATAGAISGLSTYDTGFDNNTDVDVTAGDVGSSTNAAYINSLRFNTSSALTVTLGSPQYFVAGENNISLYIATGGILETANVGANADVITSGVLSSNDQTEIVVTQNNTAAPLTISSSISNYNVSGINLGLSKAGPGNLILNGTNTYTGKTFVTGGTLTIASSVAMPTGANLSIGTLASVVAVNGGSGTYALSLTTLTNYGLIDLTTNAMVVHTGSTIASLTQQVQKGYNAGTWTGTAGITSSSAAADATHLTAVGVIVNDSSGTPLYGSGGSINSTFEGATPVDGDLLIKYTYYGDTDLNGEVDGSDYSRIDAAFLAEQSSGTAVSGWANGDFNYDGVVNGSDYTLMDNAFNTQGAQLADLIAGPQAVSTAQIAQASGTSAVPEPTTLGLLGLGAIGLLGRRRNRRS